MSWERGPLARTGPKARKAPTGATCPSRLLPRAGHTSAGGAQCRRGRPWVPCRGRALEKPESVGVAPLPMRRAFGPLAGGTPALPGCGSGSDVLGARASCPHRAEGPQSADRSDTPEPATPPSRPHPRPRRPMPSRSVLGALPRTGTGGARERGRRPLGDVAGLRPACGRDARAPRVWPVSDVPGSAGILPATGRRPAKCRQERHARAGYSPEPATPPSRLLPRAGYSPEPATPPPEAPNAVEAGLGCPAEDGRWRSPRAWASPAWRCGGPAARLRAGRPRSQGVALGVMSLGARASGPQRAEGPQSADRSDTPEPATPPSRPHARPRRTMPSRPTSGALPRTGAGAARERGRRPLAHVAGLRPACGRDARAPRVWLWE